MCQGSGRELRQQHLLQGLGRAMGRCLLHWLCLLLQGLGSVRGRCLLHLLHWLLGHQGVWGDRRACLGA